MAANISPPTAARVIVIDVDQGLLLLKWRDPGDGKMLWEPPGGTIESGEVPLGAARRELYEETGLPATLILPAHVTVARDVWWNGKHIVGSELFYLAVTTEPPDVKPVMLVGHEIRSYVGHGWFNRTELLAMSDRVEPPNLIEVTGRLCQEVTEAFEREISIAPAQITNIRTILVVWGESNQSPGPIEPADLDDTDD